MAGINKRSIGESVVLSRSSSQLSGTSTRKDDTVTALSSSHNLAPYPKLSDLPPVGQSLWRVVWERDPGSPLKKQFYVLLTVICLGYTLHPSILLHFMPWLDVSWDQKHGVTDLLGVIEVSCGLSALQVQSMLWITLIAMLSMITADVGLGLLNSKAVKQRQSDVYPWPLAWNTDNYLCYHDMFSEPTRHGRLMRRPGNTLSNAVYFLTCMIVFSSCFWSTKPNHYLLSDLEFGTMLLILLITSVVWHASNAPWSQYPDLWSMYSSIAYLIIRYLCEAGLLILTKHFGVDLDSAKWWTGTICFWGYTAFVAAFGSFYYTLYQKGYLHGPSPDSIRARITGNSDVFGQGHQDIYVGVVCAFAAIPFVAVLFPTIIQIGLFSVVGSRIGGNWGFRSLMVGWTYRLLEKFVLDGHPVMNYFVAQPAGIFKTVGCAILSPTAQHHVLTGITLLTGYAHGRSMEGMGQS